MVFPTDYARRGTKRSGWDAQALEPTIVRLVGGHLTTCTLHFSVTLGNTDSWARAGRSDEISRWHNLGTRWELCPEEAFEAVSQEDP